MATFRKRGSKWHVQVRRSGHPAITRSFTHKADAEAWVRKTERQIDNGDVVANHHTLKSHTIGSLPKRYEATITPKRDLTLLARSRFTSRITNATINARDKSDTSTFDLAFTTIARLSDSLSVAVAAVALGAEELTGRDVADGIAGNSAIVIAFAQRGR